jgi:lysophospholipase L1-like esterase
MSHYRQIAALGSSFAAGPGIQPVADPAAMRSTRNYAHLLADRLGAELVDLTVSGATTVTILHTPQVTMTGAQYPPQVHGLPADADLVTVTAGGNDLHFAASMLYEAWSRTDPTSPIVTLMAEQFPDGIPAPTPTSVDAMAQGLVDIVREVRSRAVDARVVLVTTSP